MKANSYDNPGRAGGNLESVGNRLSMLAPTETPFFSMIPKTGANAVLSETVADTLRKPRLIGGREGVGASGQGSQASKRQRFGTYQHKLFDNWAVSDVQQAVAKRGATRSPRTRRPTPRPRRSKRSRRTPRQSAFPTRKCREDPTTK